MAARPVGSADRGVPRVHQLAGSAAHLQVPIKHSLKPRLAVFAPSAADVIGVTGGWLFDQVLAGWDVTAVTAGTAVHVDQRPLRILGVRGVDLESALGFPVQGSCLQAIAVCTELYRGDERVRQLVLAAADAGRTDIRAWGDAWPDDFDGQAGLVSHRLSAAARAFKAQALAATKPPSVSVTAATDGIEVFRRAAIRRLAMA